MWCDFILSPRGPSDRARTSIPKMSLGPHARRALDFMHGLQWGQFFLTCSLWACFRFSCPYFSSVKSDLSSQWTHFLMFFSIVGVVWRNQMISLLPDRKHRLSIVMGTQREQWVVKSMKWAKTACILQVSVFMAKTLWYFLSKRNCIWPAVPNAWIWCYGKQWIFCLTWGIFSEMSPWLRFVS